MEGTSEFKLYQNFTIGISQMVSKNPRCSMLLSDLFNGINKTIEIEDTLNNIKKEYHKNNPFWYYLFLVECNHLHNTKVELFLEKKSKDIQNLLIKIFEIK